MELRTENDQVTNTVDHQIAKGSGGGLTDAPGIGSPVDSTDPDLPSDHRDDMSELYNDLKTTVSNKQQSSLASWRVLYDDFIGKGDVATEQEAGLQENLKAVNDAFSMAGTTMHREKANHEKDFMDMQQKIQSLKFSGAVDKARQEKEAMVLAARKIFADTSKLIDYVEQGNYKLTAKANDHLVKIKSQTAKAQKSMWGSIDKMKKKSVEWADKDIKSARELVSSGKQYEKTGKLQVKMAAKVAKAVTSLDQKLLVAVTKSNDKTAKEVLKAALNAAKTLTKASKAETKMWGKELVAHGREHSAEWKDALKHFEMMHKRLKDKIEDIMAPAEQIVKKTDGKVDKQEQAERRMKGDIEDDLRANEKYFKELGFKKNDAITEFEDAADQYKAPKEDSGQLSSLEGKTAPFVSGAHVNIGKAMNQFVKEKEQAKSQLETTWNEQEADISVLQTELEAAEEHLKEHKKLGPQLVDAFTEKYAAKHKNLIDEAEMAQSEVRGKLARFLRKLAAPLDRDAGRMKTHLANHKSRHLDMVDREIVSFAQPINTEIHDKAFGYLEYLPGMLQTIVDGKKGWGQEADELTELAGSVGMSAQDFAKVIAHFAKETEKEAKDETTEAAKLEEKSQQLADAKVADARNEAQNANAEVMKAFQSLGTSLGKDLSTANEHLGEQMRAAQKNSMLSRTELIKEMGALLSQANQARVNIPRVADPYSQAENGMGNVDERVEHVTVPSETPLIEKNVDDYEKSLEEQGSKGQAELQDLTNEQLQEIDKVKQQFISNARGESEATATKLHSIANAVEMILQANVGSASMGKEALAKFQQLMQGQVEQLTEQIDGLVETADGVTKQAALQYRDILKQAQDAAAQFHSQLPDATDGLSNQVLSGLRQLSDEEKMVLKEALAGMDKWDARTRGKLTAAGLKIRDEHGVIDGLLKVGHAHLGDIVDALDMTEEELEKKLAQMRVESTDSVAASKAEGVETQVAASMGGTNNVMQGLEARLAAASHGFSDEAAAQAARAKIIAAHMQTLAESGTNDMAAAEQQVRAQLEAAGLSFNGAVDKASESWKELQHAYMAQLHTANSERSDMNSQLDGDWHATKLQMQKVQEFANMKSGNLVDNLSSVFSACFNALAWVEAASAKDVSQRTNALGRNSRRMGMIGDTKAVRELNKMRTADELVAAESKELEKMLDFANAHTDADREFRVAIVDGFKALGHHFQASVDHLSNVSEAAHLMEQKDVQQEEAEDRAEVRQEGEREADETDSTSATEKNVISSNAASSEAKEDAIEAKMDEEERAMEDEESKENAANAKDKADSQNMATRLAAFLANGGSLEDFEKQILKEIEQKPQAERELVKKKLQNALSIQSLVQLDAGGVASLRAAGMPEQGVHALLEKRHHDLAEQVQKLQTHAS